MPYRVRYPKRMKKFAKKYLPKAGKAIYATARNRYTSRGGANLNAIAKDVMLLKHLVNVEKKRHDRTISTPVNFAQYATAGITGAYSAVVTPNISEGVTGGQRIGLSIKLVSACLDIQFGQQANQAANLKIKWYLVMRPDNAQNITASVALSECFEPNPFSGVIDFWSSRDAEYFTNFRIIKTGTVNLLADQTTGVNTFKQIKVPLKFNHHLKYNTDASSITTKNQFYLFAMASSGDTGATQGASIIYNMRWYYTDN